MSAPDCRPWILESLVSKEAVTRKHIGAGMDEADRDLTTRMLQPWGKRCGMRKKYPTCPSVWDSDWFSEHLPVLLMN